jgi:class 3 adenylate cyclase
LRPLRDGRFDARDAVVLSTVNALLAAGTRPEDLETAIRVTLEIIGAIDTAGLPPGHAGVAAGRVVVREWDVFGRVVNLAVRIAGQAGPGEIVVEEGVVVALRVAPPLSNPSGAST